MRPIFPTALSTVTRSNPVGGVDPLGGPPFALENDFARLGYLKRDPRHDLAATKQSLTKSVLKKLGTPY